ncbi:MAG: glutamate racemase [Nitrosopumilus sp. B06]|nr:MAG: glutamate racemase [Nitrosopumilus sp. D6]RNJ79256.1 MAG: glutamate racemase [Nitrosopumilus sp. B06]
MAKIAVFDSGLGSLSVIRAIQKQGRFKIIYLADQKNYPYGLKSRAELDRIVRSTIRALRERFSPDVIVVASNTPGLMLEIRGQKIVSVRPPLADALAVSATGNIAILGTRSAIKSRGLSRYIARKKLSGWHKFYRIDGSGLVDLVESGKFLTDRGRCSKIIRQTLDPILSKNSIDTIILASTHLPLLLPLLADVFPAVRFVDPGESVAKKVRSMVDDSQRNSLCIFTTGSPAKMQKTLARLGVRNKVSFFSA